MFITLSQTFILVTIIFVPLLKCINCDCGRPEIPFGAYIFEKIQPIISENFTIKYYCVSNNLMIYNPIRTCREGKWTGRALKCGNF
jgi:hypothetical protein